MNVIENIRQLKRLLQGIKKCFLNIVSTLSSVVIVGNMFGTLNMWDCNAETAKCIQIVCTIKKLPKGTESTIRIKSRVWNSTLVEDYNNVDWVKMISRAQIILSDPNIEQKREDDFAQTSADAYPEIRTQEDRGISIWVYIGAALAGLLLLILLVTILWKLRFFKRNRVEDPTLSRKLEKSEDETLLQK